MRNLARVIVFKFLKYSLASFCSCLLLGFYQIVQPINQLTHDNIKKFSKKVGKYMKLNEHVTILDSPQNRDYFTRHGSSLQWTQQGYHM
jgi:hypothetical protein